MKYNKMNKKFNKRNNNKMLIFSKMKIILINCNNINLKIFKSQMIIMIK